MHASCVLWQTSSQVEVFFSNPSYVCMYVHTYSIAWKLLAVSHSLVWELSAAIYVHVAVSQEGRVHCGQGQVPFRSSSISFAPQYFMLLVTLLQTNQSVEMLQHIFAFIRCFIHKVSSMYCICSYALMYCNVL